MNTQKLDVTNVVNFPNSIKEFTEWFNASQAGMEFPDSRACVIMSTEDDGWQKNYATRYLHCLETWDWLRGLHERIIGEHHGQLKERDKTIESYLQCVQANATYANKLEIELADQKQFVSRLEDQLAVCRSLCNAKDAELHKQHQAIETLSKHCEDLENRLDKNHNKKSKKALAFG